METATCPVDEYSVLVLDKWRTEIHGYGRKGVPKFQAPEFDREHFTSASSIFAIGMLIKALCRFESKPDAAWLASICDQMCSVNPSDRPTPQQLL